MRRTLRLPRLFPCFFLVGISILAHTGFVTERSFAAAPIPPSITDQPQDLTLDVGQRAVFTVAATGSPPLQYQWYFNNATLASATNSTLVLREVSTNMNGTFRVLISNASGVTVASRAASLKVIIPVPPVIIEPPLDVTAPVGSTVNFTPGVSGSPPFHYQWSFNGAALPAATNATLTLQNIATNQAGAYTITITNRTGSRAASQAILVVTPPSPFPPNDLFAKRTVLVGLPLHVTNSNANATREIGEPFFPEETGSKSIWWSWTTPLSATVTVSTSGSNFDTLLAVYTGSDLGKLTLVALNDDDPTGGTNSVVRFRALAGIPYQITVDTFDGRTGIVQLHFTSEPDRSLLRATTSGQNLVLTWPTNLVDFQLETVGNIVGETWSPVALKPTITGEQFSLKVPLLRKTQFYRLQAP